MTVHFHCRRRAIEWRPALEVTHHLCNDHVDVDLRLGLDILTIHAELPEAEQLAYYFREAADALAEALEGEAANKT